MSGELYEMALTVPWCATPEALEAMLSIAARDPLPQDEITRRMYGPQSLAMRKGERRDDSKRMAMHGSVARIPIDGPIYRYADFFTAVSGGITTDALGRDFQAALDDPAVTAILLAIDSPGGEATGINELADAIYAARGVKPIVAYIEGIGASAAYWIASAADLVVVDDTARVGSIGTVMAYPDPTKQASRSLTFVSAQSPKKRPDPHSDSGKAYLQGLVDDMTEVFIAKVARNRGIDAADVLAVEGGMVIGQQAVDAGLADLLGSEEGALGALLSGALPARSQKQFSSVSRGAPAAKEKPMAKGFWAWMGGGDETPAGPPPALASEQLVAVTAPLQSKASDDDRAAKLAAENAELRATFAKVQAERITADAETFVTQQIAVGHAYPAEAQALTALYVRCAQLDRPIESGEPSAVALFKTAIEARPANRMASNLLASTVPIGSRALTNSGGDTSMLDDAEQSARAYAAKANGKAK
jgi:ClpP class serine protease